MIACSLRFLVCLGCLAAAALPLSANEYDLTPLQDRRMKQYLPRTYAKLEKRQPVHVVTVGDSVMGMYGYSQEYNNTLKSYQTVLLRELADQFYYPGGVRVVGAAKGQPEKLQDIIGLEITMQNLSRGGKLMLHAMQPLGTVAFENNPDLVMVSYGINDSTFNCSLKTYRRSLEEVIATVRAHKADLMLFGPTLVAGDPPEQAFAQTRPYADVMREVAEQQGIFYADLGDLSWFVRLDDRNAHLAELMAEQRKQSPTLKEKLAASPVISPLAGQLDPDPEKKAARLFSSVVEDYRKHFNHGDVKDWVHPDANFHRQLGRRVFAELLNGPKVSPWKIGAASLVLDGAGQCVLKYQLENVSDERQDIAVLPLVSRDWKPLMAPTELVLEPGKSSEVSISYAPKPDAAPGGMALSEALLRMPVLHANADMVHIDDVRAVIQPVALVWNEGATFNVENTAVLEGQMFNTSGVPVSGKWQASLFGRKSEGVLSIPQGGQTPVRMQLPVPAGQDLRSKGRLQFTFSSDGREYHFDRRVEVVRNVGLKESVTLLADEGYVEDKPLAAAQPGPGTAGVAFRADADAQAFYLTWDIYGLNLQDSPNGQGAFVADVNLDARSYGKRLTLGATDVLRITGAAADGECRVGGLLPWVFGTGYAMSYDAKNVKARLSSRPDGSRRLTVALPRAYLYLHEWQLGNGNSQLGINTVIACWQKDEANPQGGKYETFFMTANGFNRDDAESLCVLELTDKPTRRWTVRLY